MFRRFSLVLAIVFAVLLVAWPMLPAQDAKTGLDDLPPAVKARLEELRKAAAAKSWSFEVSYSKAADFPLEVLAGTRIPTDIKVDETADRVNIRGTQWLQADHKTRDAFAKKNPGVLPGQKLEPRTQHDTFAKKGRFDWRDYQKVTAVRDQKSCGSCWDFTALGAFECNYLIRNNITIDASEQQVLDCSGAGSCAGGWWMGVFDFLIKHGVGTEQASPYQNAQGKCKSVNSPYKAVSWGFVAKDGAIPSVDAMKDALCQHGPLAVAVNATDAFKYYSKGVFNENASGNINHGVLLVGWDDSKGKNGAWAIRNSWSDKWGDNGYMWIEYGSNRIGDHAAWVESTNTHYELMILLAKDYRVKQNEDVLAPIYLLNPTDVKNLDWTLTYNPSVATLVAPKVVQGNLPLTLFEAKLEDGLVRMGFAQANPITNKGVGTVAVLRFKAVGAPGSRTPLVLGITRIDNPSGHALPIKLIHGSIEIVKDSQTIPKGSCTGEEKLNIEDARCALQMSVGNRAVNLQMDMDNDSKVTSRDAAIIIQTVLDEVRTGQ